MNSENYLKTYQPNVYKTLEHALKDGNIAHAYLLSGEAGIPLLSMAKFLAKSIICDNPTPFACEQCLTCARVDYGNYQDIVILDGASASLKKDEINQVITSFSYTAKEAKGVLIYIIHLVENMTNEAINALLRFLEEPVDDVYAILTTENEERVLPTIISRTQLLRFKLIDRKKVINEANELGVYEEDAELLSYFYNNAYEIKEHTNDEKYLSLKELFRNYLEEMNKGRGEVVYFTQTILSNKLRAKEDVRMFLDLFIDFFKNMQEAKYTNDYIFQSFKSIIDALNQKLDHMEETLDLLFTLRQNIEMNVNIPLLFDKLTYSVTKGMKKL